VATREQASDRELHRRGLPHDDFANLPCECINVFPHAETIRRIRPCANMDARKKWKCGELDSSRSVVEQEGGSAAPSGDAKMMRLCRLN
jgi:hypothetical protein